MKKSTVALLVIGALIVGLASGGMVVFHFGTRLVGYGTTAAESAEAAVLVHALQRLRGNDAAGALELLESSLDGAVISINSFLLAAPKKQRDANAEQALQLAKDYREKFPRKTSIPEVDQAVAQALDSPGK